MSGLPKGWVEATFSDLFDFKGGSQPPKSEFRPDEGPNLIRLLQIRDFASDEKAVYIEDNDRWPKCSSDDIMIGRYGASVGKILSGKSGAYNVALVKLLFDSNSLERLWVENFLKSRHFQEPLRKVSRSAQNGFNKGDVSDILVQLPPLAEQKRIVAKLDALSARSARARKDLSRIDTLVTRYKQAVLSKAFSGELTKDWRNTKRVGLTEAEIAEIARLVDVAAKSRRGARTGTHQIDLKRLANIPTSWAKGIVGMASEMLVGFAFKSSWYVENGVKLLRGANIAPGQIDWDDLKSLAPDKAVEYSKYELQRDDIVLAMDRPIISTGLKIAQVTEGDEGCLLVQRVARLRPTTHAIQSYVWWFMNSADFIDHSVSRSTGSDLPHISGDDISTCPLPLPPLNEQKEIVRRIESAFQKIDRLAAEAKRALALTDKLDEAILAKAFRGELVPQDPTDEPASILLERIKAEREAEPKAKRGRRKVS